MCDLLLLTSGALGLRARSKGPLKVYQSWPQVGARTSKTVLRICWRLFLAYLGTWGVWEGTKLGIGFKEPAGLLESPGKVESLLSSL